MNQQVFKQMDVPPKEIIDRQLAHVGA